MTSLADAAVLGIDIGGTKVAAGVVGRDGRLRSSVRALTPTDADGEGLFRFVVALAERARREGAQPVDALGVGCGGPMLFPEGVVSPLHIPVWRDFPLRARLEAALGLPTVVDNDAKAFALGEVTFGAGRGASCVLGMVVSTGVGGGVVVDGGLHYGASGNAGEIGHTIVSTYGPRCPCGAIGCVTAYASGRGLAARALAALRRGSRSVLADLPRDAVTAQTIAAAAAAGDALAARLMCDAGVALGRAIANAANLFDLDRVVIGGGIAQADALLFPPLHRELRERARLPFLADLAVLPASLGIEAGVIGAASLALGDHATRVSPPRA